MPATGDERRVKQSCLLQLDRCCFLLPLKLGVRLIGIAELVVSIGLLIVTNILSKYFSTTAEPTSDEVLFVNYTAVIDGLLAVYLLVGVQMGRAHYSKMWSGAQTVHLVASFLVVGWRNLSKGTHALTGMAYLELLLSTGLDAYFILVVYSFYRQSQDGQSEHVEPTSVV